ncbi:MAG: hypothetical protein ACP5K4_07475 [Caldisericum sp.]
MNLIEVAKELFLRTQYFNEYIFYVRMSESNYSVFILTNKATRFTKGKISKISSNLYAIKRQVNKTTFMKMLKRKSITKYILMETYTYDRDLVKILYDLNNVVILIDIKSNEVKINSKTHDDLNYVCKVEIEKEKGKFKLPKEVINVIQKCNNFDLKYSVYCIL